MKKFLVIFEGAADSLRAELGDRTPLQVAGGKASKRLATLGRGGLLAPLGEQPDLNRPGFLARLLGVPAGDAVKIRRGPVEAVAQGIDLTSIPYVYRGSFITVEEDTVREDHVGNLTRVETEILINSLRDMWEREGLTLVTTGPARFLVLCRTGDHWPEAQTPMLARGQHMSDFLPVAKAASVINDLIYRSREQLSAQSVNEIRLDLGENPANGVWLWGGGRPYKPQTILNRKSGPGFLLTQCDMARGLGEMLGFEIGKLENPWTADQGHWKGFRLPMIVDVLTRCDFMVVYIEAPNELGRYGSATEKVMALDWLDRVLLEPLVDVQEAQRPSRILLATDGPFSPGMRDFEPGATPFVLAGDNVNPDDVDHWDEVSCKHGGMGVVDPGDVISLIEKEN